MRNAQNWYYVSFNEVQLLIIGQAKLSMMSTSDIRLHENHIKSFNVLFIRTPLKKFKLNNYSILWRQ